HEWLEDLGFNLLVSRYRSKLLDSTLGRLSDAAVKAIETLVEILDSEESDGVRVRAALGILDQLVRMRETSVLQQRLPGHFVKPVATRVRARDRGLNLLDGFNVHQEIVFAADAKDRISLLF